MLRCVPRVDHLCLPRRGMYIHSSTLAHMCAGWHVGGRAGRQAVWGEGI